MTDPVEVKDLGIQADSKEVLDMDDPRLEGLIEAVSLVSTRCSATASSYSVI